LLVTGGGSCFTLIPSLIHVGLYFDKRRAVANGISTAGSGIGQFAFPLLFEFLQENYGYFGAMLIFGGIMLHLVVAGILYRPLVKDIVVEDENSLLPTTSEVAQPVVCDKKLVKESEKSDHSQEDSSISNIENAKCVPGKSSCDKDTNMSECDMKTVGTPQHDPKMTGTINLENSISFHRSDNDLKDIIYRSENDLKNTTSSLHDDCGNELKREKSERETDLKCNDECDSYLHRSENVLNSAIEDSTALKRTNCFSTCIDADSHSCFCTNKLGKKSVDFKLLIDPSFLLYSLAIAFSTMGYILIRTFIPALVESRGHPRTLSAQLLAYIGVADMSGRLLGGFFFDMEKIRPIRLYLYNLLPFLICFAVGVFPSAQHPGEYICVCILYGFFVGIFVAQRSCILADLVGVEKFSDAMGLAMFFQGSGLLIGPSVGGMYFAKSQSSPALLFFQI
jgi:hypothetical protein